MTLVAQTAKDLNGQEMMAVREHANGRSRVVVHLVGAHRRSGFTPGEVKFEVACGQPFAYETLPGKPYDHCLQCTKAALAIVVANEAITKDSR